MRILVSGGYGFIASAFVRNLLGDKKADVDILNLDAMTYAADVRNLEPVLPDKRYQAVLGDVASGAFVDAIAGEYKPDTIVHFAAESHVDRSITNANTFVSTNIIGTYNMLEVARKLGCRLVYASTDEVYGDMGKREVATERTPLAPSSPYSAAKAAGDHLCHAYRRTHRTNVVVVRSTNNYGPYQHPEKLIPKAITTMSNNIAARHNNKMGMYAGGENVREWLHVDDNVEAIKLIMHKGTDLIYNVGTGERVSNRRVLESIARLFGENFKDVVMSVPDRRGHDFRYAVDSVKVRRLGWSPKTDFNDGLANTVEWYNYNRWWWEKKL